MRKTHICSAASGGINKLLFRIFIVFVFQLATGSLWGQLQQKKELTEADYGLWENTETDKLSPDGRWVSYNFGYESGADTLFVRNTKNSKTYYIPSGWNSIFTKDGFFYSQSGNDLHSINLETGKQVTITGVQAYQYAEKHNLLIYISTDSAKVTTLQVQYPKGKVLKTIGNAVQYSLSPDGQHLLYSVLTDGKYAVWLADLNQIMNGKLIVPEGKNKFTQFVWSKDSKAAAFYSSEKNTIESILFYRLDLQKLFELNPVVQAGFPENWKIVSVMHKMLISDDLQKVFFEIRKNPTDPPRVNPSGPEIWNANDKVLYSRGRDIAIEFPRLAMWWPATGKFSQITTKELPEVMLSGDQQHALLSNPLDYEPQFYDDEGPRDYYLLDLNTMQKKKILTKVPHNMHYVIPSPGGRYFAYFNHDNWWAYDIIRDAHTNLTGGLGTEFAGRIGLDPRQAFGNPGWSADNKEILLYDEYDIWAIRPDGRRSRRLTRGCEQQIRYRFGEYNDNRLQVIFDGMVISTYDLSKEIILNGRGFDGRTGYFLWKNNKIEKPIVYEDAAIDQLQFSAGNLNMVYRRQKFDLPQQIIFKEGKEKEKIVLQSNPQHQNYHWGRSQLVHFENSKNQKLRGVLYYPASYDPQKKYPMIVHVYGMQSGVLHNYVAPTVYDASGFNQSVLTSKGYFVFLPDILHGDYNVGPSALDCVTAGVKKVISMEIIDPGKIGLMGHSYGGYETAFIINHSPLFKTAIPSGAIIDLTSMFLNMNANTGKPDMWRFGKQQWQMLGKNPFEHSKDFERNSPLESVTGLKIPVMHWTGKVDAQVDWHQSIEYYLALRRLGKKNIMLLYPGEGHNIVKPANQEDLMRRVLQWFGYFLKDEKNVEWISRGIQ